jgi:hypothetical protein
LVSHGAHRTGKTTTAIEVAKNLGVPFVNANVSGMSVWTTIKPSDNMTFVERLQVQEMILSELETCLERHQSIISFVIDRTPMDVLMYLLSNIDSTTSSIFDARGEAFINKCIELSAKYFTHYVIIPPVIPFIGDTYKTGKVFSSKMYQESLTNVVIGAYYRYFDRLRTSVNKTLIIVPDSLTALEDRVNFVVTNLTIFDGV